MSVEFNKSGVILASGDNINENLVLNSENISVSHLESGNEYIAIDLGQSYMDIPSGSQVTVSFDLELKYTNGGGTSNYFLIYNTNRKGPKQIANVRIDSIVYNGETVGTTIKKRVYGTTTISDRSSPSTTNNYIELFTTYNSGNVFKISNLKIELGAVATPWCQNSNDVGYVGSNHGLIETTTLPSRLYDNHIETIEYIEY